VLAPTGLQSECATALALNHSKKGGASLHGITRSGAHAFQAQAINNLMTLKLNI